MTLVQQTVLAFVIFLCVQWSVPRFVVAEPYPLRAETLRGRRTRKRTGRVYHVLILLAELVGAVAAAMAWLSMGVGEYYRRHTIARFDEQQQQVAGDLLPVHPSQAVFSLYFISLMAHAGVRMACQAALWNNLSSASKASVSRACAWGGVVLFTLAGIGCFASQVTAAVNSAQVARQICGGGGSGSCQSAVIALASFSSPLWIGYALLGCLALIFLVCSIEFLPFHGCAT